MSHVAHRHDAHDGEPLNRPGHHPPTPCGKGWGPSPNDDDVEDSRGNLEGKKYA